METRRLEYFVRIVDAGSISRAAQDLGLAQPALSQQLAILEQDVKAQLLHRSRQGVQPTAAGLQFYRQARIILRQIEEARSLVKTAAESLAGTVSVGFPNSAAAILCLPLIERLSTEHPQIELHITEGYNAMLTEMTAKGQLDLSVLYQDGPSPGMTAEPLWVEDFLLVGPPGSELDDRVPLEVIGRLPMLIPAKANSARTILDKCLESKGITANVALQAESLVTLKKAVGQGMGYTILPWPAVAEEAEKGLLSVAVIDDRRLKRTVALCTPDTVPLTPAREMVGRMIRAIAAEALADGRGLGMRPPRRRK
ncbi:MAG: LysR substrate-binding domain-containing protein [Rhodospirillales bacterium]